MSSRQLLDLRDERYRQPCVAGRSSGLKAQSAADSCRHERPQLTPGAARVKCAKIAGDTSGTTTRTVRRSSTQRSSLAQDGTCGIILIDKQGNFGSIAASSGCDAVHRSETRPPAAMLLEDLKLDTVDFIPTTTNAAPSPSSSLQIPESARQRSDRDRGRMATTSLLTT